MDACETTEHVRSPQLARSSAPDAIVNVLGSHGPGDFLWSRSCKRGQDGWTNCSGLWSSEQRPCLRPGKVIDKQNPGAVTTLNPSSIGALALLICPAG
jgi:hypothetical protein